MEIQIITSRDVARCPKSSLLPGHYRFDGSCRCDEREDAQAEVAAARAAFAAARDRLRRT